eukprot:347446-Amphidinium_carterae.1
MHSGVIWALPQHTASVFPFVVSLCDSIGCAFVALQTMGIKLTRVPAEFGAELRAHVRRTLRISRRVCVCVCVCVFVWLLPLQWQPEDGFCVVYKGGFKSPHCFVRIPKTVLVSKMLMHVIVFTQMAGDTRWPIMSVAT